MPESETLLKVLLVDDEPFITKGLAVLVDWNALGFAIEGAVSNGRQALLILLSSADTATLNTPVRRFGLTAWSICSNRS